MSSLHMRDRLEMTQTLLLTLFLIFMKTLSSDNYRVTYPHSGGLSGLAPWQCHVITVA